MEQTLTAAVRPVVVLVAFYNKKALGVRYLETALEHAGYVVHNIFYKDFNSVHPTPTTPAELELLRQENGYSQEILAELAGLHPTYIGQVERGEKNITVDSLAKITGALGISMAQVLAGAEEPPAEPGYPRKASDLLSGCSPERQAALYQIMALAQDLPPR